jgi:glycosyltransferase involved in cell wall biosynthesis
MRVGIDLYSEKGTPGGVHTYTNALLEHLVRLRDFDPSIGLELVVFAHSDYQFSVSPEALSGLDLHLSGRRGLGAAARRLLQHFLVPRLARRHGVELLHSVNNVLPDGLPVPGVVTVHDLSPYVLPRRFGWLKTAYLRRQVPASVRRAAKVLCASEATAQEVLRYVRGVHPQTLAVTHLAAASLFHAARSAAEEDRLRAQLRLPERFFFHVSLIEPAKNLSTVSEALSLLRAEGTSAELVVAGAATRHLDVLRAQWRRLGVASQVHYVGEVPACDLGHLYRMCCALVFPSLYEGFGLPLVEAFACGAPVVTSDCAALREVAGKAALIVPASDPQPLARALRRLWRYDELRELLRLRGARRAAQFSWQSCAEKTLAAYSEVLGEPRRPKSRDADLVSRVSRAETSRKPLRSSL